VSYQSIRWSDQFETISSLSCLPLWCHYQNIARAPAWVVCRPGRVSRIAHTYFQWHALAKWRASRHLGRRQLTMSVLRITGARNNSCQNSDLSAVNVTAALVVMVCGKHSTVATYRRFDPSIVVNIAQAATIQRASVDEVSATLFSYIRNSRPIKGDQVGFILCAILTHD